MKSKMIRLAVVLALLVSLFAVAAPPALAAPATVVTLAPTTGPVGTTVSVTVTITQAVGDPAFTVPAQTVSIIWDTAGAKATVATATMASTAIPACVALPCTTTYLVTTFKVPDSTGGAKTVSVSGPVLPAVTTAAFTVTPQVKVTSPTTRKGPKGTTVELKATGFNKNTGLTVSGNSVDPDGSGVLGDEVGASLAVRATLTTDANGSATGSFSAVRTEWLVATDGVGAVYDGTAGADTINKFTVTAKITLSPTSGLVGTKVTITATQFDPTATAIAAGGVGTGVLFAGTALTHEFTNLEANLGVGEYIVKTAVSTTEVADTVLSRSYTSPASGKFTLILMLPANANAGVNQIKVTTNGAGAAEINSATANFTVTARTLSLNPNSGVIGNSVLATAAGFSKSKSGGTLTCTAGCTGAPITLVTAITTDASGGAQASFMVPSTFVTGSNTITFTDGNGNTASATFTVSGASITISPIEGAPGTTVTIQGTAFTGNSLVSITFTPVGSVTALPVPTTPSTIVTNSIGDFSATFILPASGTGIATVTATVGATSKSKDFTVKAAVQTVDVVLAPIAGKYTIVWGFDAATQTWQKFDPAAPAVSDLAKLQKGKGYWIFATEATTLVWGSGVYDLAAGWNLIGWLG